jgi:hypothetical protein
MPYVGRDFDPMDTEEIKDLSIDFTSELGDCDQVASATWSISVVTGTDASASSRLSGDPTITCNSKVTQRHTTLQDGVRYRTQCTATTKNGEILILYSHVRGIAVDDEG